MPCSDWCHRGNLQAPNIFTYEKQMATVVGGVHCLHYDCLADCKTCTVFVNQSLYLHQNNQTMKKNIGTADRVIRVILAVLFAVLYFTHTVTGTLGLVLLILGGVFLFTSILGFCPLYAIVGLSTCPKEK